MDVIMVNNFTIMAKDALKVLVVQGNGTVLLVDVATSTIQDVTGKDVLIGYYNSSSPDGDVSIDVLDKGVANTALSCFYSRGIG